MHILMVLILSAHKHGVSFPLVCVCVLFNFFYPLQRFISYIYSYWFRRDWKCDSFLDFFDDSLRVYNNATEFWPLPLYPTALLSLLVLVASFAFCTFKTMSSTNNASITFSFPVFQFFLLPNCSVQNIQCYVK